MKVVDFLKRKREILAQHPFELKDWLSPAIRDYWREFQQKAHLHPLLGRVLDLQSDSQSTQQQQGTAPVYLAWYLQIKPVYLGFIGVAACLGHMYPIFFHFRGGKGVATALGTMMPIGFTMGGAVIGTWLLVLLVSGYSSLASIITVLLTPLFTYLLKPEYTLPVSLLSCLILIRHHENIARLLKGEEPRVWGRQNRAEQEEVLEMDDPEQKRDERDKK